MKFLTTEMRGDVALIGLNRLDKRIAIPDAFSERRDVAFCEAEMTAKPGREK